MASVSWSRSTDLVNRTASTPQVAGTQLQGWAHPASSCFSQALFCSERAGLRIYPVFPVNAPVIRFALILSSLWMRMRYASCTICLDAPNVHSNIVSLTPDCRGGYIALTYTNTISRWAGRCGRVTCMHVVEERGNGTHARHMQLFVSAWRHRMGI
jgi:hypothetical protein